MILVPASVLALALAAAPAARGPAAAEAESEPRPLHHERLLTAADLEGRSLRELSLMRNWIYARHGHPFRRSWLREYFGEQPWYEPGEPVGPDRLSERERANAVAIARHELSIPRDELGRRRDALRSRDELSPEEEIERTLLDERLGVWRPASEGERATPLGDPSQLDELLTIDRLADLSRRDLRLLRNLVYARRGRPFESELLRLHFARFEWYEPDSTYRDERLSPIDRRNIKLIRSLEDEIGGPLTDEEERDWLSAA